MAFESFFKPKPKVEQGTNVIDIKTGKPVEVESVPNNDSFKTTEQAFDALFAAASDEGIKLYRKMGFLDMRKMEKLPLVELMERKESFVQAVLGNPEMMLPMGPIRFWMRMHKEILDKGRTSTVEESTAQMERDVIDRQLRIRIGLDEKHISVLKELFPVE